MNKKENYVNVALNTDLLLMTIDSLSYRLKDKDAEIEKLKSDNPVPVKPTRKRRTRDEIEASFVCGMPSQYLMTKSNGMPKAQRAEAIRSYDDFKAIQDYFLERGDIRSYALWTIGVSFGIRISDLVTLRFCHLLNEDMTYRDRVFIYEKKTSKLNQLLITDSVKAAVDKLIKAEGDAFQYGSFLFKSRRTGVAIDEKTAHRLLKNAQRALNLPINIGSHTMRKSFGDIGVCVSKYRIDPEKFSAISRRYNHSDPRYTMMYLGVYQRMEDEIQKSISDFVLGKSNVNELRVAESYTLEDIATKIDELISMAKKTEE